MAYQIFTDATADLTDELLQGLPEVTVIPMTIEIGGLEFSYGLKGGITVQTFYDLQRQGAFAKTSQINPEAYVHAFEGALAEGLDVVYLCFSSGMSGCLQSARIAAEELGERYPNRRIICIDTLCASVGEALLVMEAARHQARGESLEELEQWILQTRGYVCHWFTVDTFDHLKHGGRVGAASAAMGTMLNIKPMLHVDEMGKLAVSAKPRGRKKAMEAQLAQMDKGWTPVLSNLVVIGHGDCPEAAEELKTEVLSRFPQAEIRIAPIGPVIGAHTGPGMLALIYWGNNR